VTAAIAIFAVVLVVSLRTWKKNIAAPEKQAENTT
jgi:hypothetical protein